MKRIRAWVTRYLLIGLVIGLTSWAMDKTSTVNELGVVLIIAIVWPLWVLIQWLAG